MLADVRPDVYDVPTMSNNYNPERERESCQADCDCNSAPDPNLWNSAVGRRAFLKKTGGASALTILAYHGFRADVLASVSIPTPRFGLISKTWTIESGPDTVITIPAIPNEPDGGLQRAMDLLVGKVQYGETCQVSTNEGIIDGMTSCSKTTIQVTKVDGEPSADLTKMIFTFTGSISYTETYYE